MATPEEIASGLTAAWLHSSKPQTAKATADAYRELLKAVKDTGQK